MGDRVLCVAALMALATPVAADGRGVATANNYQTVWGSGSVSYLSCSVTGVCGVALSTAAPATYAPCAGSSITTMNLNVDSAAGQSMLKVLTAAKAAGWMVTLYGYGGSSANSYGSCILSGSDMGQEDMYWVQVH